MTDWSTPHDRLAAVAPTQKPSRNWVWYVDRTIKAVFLIAIAYVAIAFLVMR